MTARIISADERMSQKGKVKALVVGKSGAGKTSLVLTLRDTRALFVDFEAGMLSVQNWPGDAIQVRTWQDAVNLVCLIGGPNPAAPADQPYSQAHFDYVQGLYGPREEVLGRYDLIFMDSLTVLSRLCLSWAEQQPDAIAKNGAKDMRAAYGILGREMMRLLVHAQHTPDLHVIFVAILDELADDFGRKTFQPQLEGSKVSREIGGIVDEILTLDIQHDADGTPRRVFVTDPANERGLPAKDRSGKLAPVEPADLEHIIAKING